MDKKPGNSRKAGCTTSTLTTSSSRRKSSTPSRHSRNFSVTGLAEYLRGLLTNEEVIKELIKMAQELKANADQASEYGLTEEEGAFYDALTKPRVVKDMYANDQLVAMAKELTESLRSSKTIDWRLKESARAKMRSMVKRLLKKYKYPPEEQENALDTVIKQCEIYADSDEN